MDKQAALMKASEKNLGSSPHAFCWSVLSNSSSLVVQELRFQELIGFNVFYACAQENHCAGGSCEARA